MPAFFASHVESFFWAAAMLSSAVLAAAAWPALRARLGHSAAGWGPLIGSAGIPYLALISGGISERDTGILVAAFGDGPLGGWGGRLGWGAAIVAASVLARLWRGPGAKPAVRGWHALEECRWAFYRGAAIGWVGLPWLGSIVGLLIAAVEWRLAGLARGRGEGPAGAWADWAYRSGLSTLLFIATQSFWLTIAGSLLASWLAAWLPQRAAPDLSAVSPPPSDASPPPESLGPAERGP